MALAIPASNDEKYNITDSAGQGLISIAYYQKMKYLSTAMVKLI